MEFPTPRSIGLLGKQNAEAMQPETSIVPLVVQGVDLRHALKEDTSRGINFFYAKALSSSDLCKQRMNKIFGVLNMYHDVV